MKVDRDNLVSLITDIVYLTIGVLAMIASIKFSYFFFRYNGHPIFWAILISIVYVLFLNLIFEVAIAMFIKSSDLKHERNKQRDKEMRKRYNKKIFSLRSRASLILFAWLLLVFYSVISTVGGQYDQLSDLKIDKLDSVSGGKGKVSDIQEMIEIQIERKVLYSKEISSITSRLGSVEDIEKSFEYKNTSLKNEKRLDYLRDKLLEIDSNIIKYKNDIMEVKETQNNITNGNVYKYFERVIHIPGYVIQFVLSFFPSIVLDFFAPISFAMVIFRRKK